MQIKIISTTNDMETRNSINLRKRRRTLEELNLKKGDRRMRTLPIARDML